MKKVGVAWVFLHIGLMPLWAQTPDQKKATVVYLQVLQTKEGGFSANGSTKDNPAKPSLRATLGGVRALRYFGGEVKDKAALTRFIESCFDKTAGGFGDAPGAKPDAITTSLGLMATVDAKMSTEPFAGPAIKFMETNAKTFEEIRLAAAAFEALNLKSAKADAWINELSKSRNDDGTYGKGDGLARDTGSTVAAILRLRGKPEPVDGILKAMKAGQRDDGGFGKAGEAGSDLETCYRVTRAFHMLKQKPNADKLKAFVAKCRNKDGGYGVTPGKDSSVSATYFAGIILHWLDAKE